MRQKKLPHDGVYYWAPPWKTRAVSKAPTEIPWCMWRAEAYQGPKKVGRRNIFGVVRCPKCGRRVQLMSVDVEHGYANFRPYIPPHKIRETHVAKPNQRKQRARQKQRGYGPARGK